MRCSRLLAKALETSGARSQGRQSKSWIHNAKENMQDRDEVIYIRLQKMLKQEAKVPINSSMQPNVVILQPTDKDGRVERIKENRKTVLLTCRID